MALTFKILNTTYFPLMSFTKGVLSLQFQDEGQTKINSFFQKPAKPQLFSEHGKPGSAKSKIVAKSCIIIDDDDDFKKSKIKPSIKSPNADPTNKKYKSTTGSETEKVPIKNEKASKQMAVSDKTVPVTCIPETQLLFTPPSKGSDISSSHSSRSDKKSEFSDPMLIPDTPTEEKEAAKAKKPLGRSFLFSAAQIATNPIQQAKENRQAKLLQKKQANQARKGLLSVSVDFNQQRKLDDNKTVKETCDSSERDLTEIKPCIDNVENTSSECLKTINAIDITPTKIYAESHSIKRMAKTGGSPESKRSNGVDVNGIATGVEVDNGDKENAVRQLGFDGKVLGSSEDQQSLPAKFEKASTLLPVPKVSGNKPAKKVNKAAVEREMVKQEEKRRLSEKMRKYQLTGTLGK